MRSSDSQIRSSAKDLPRRSSVFLTGVTSFTGCHIARALIDAGFEVHATLTRGLGDYTDPLIKKRMTHSRVTHWIEHAPFGSENFFQGLKKLPHAVMINHGAEIKGYRSPDFDIDHAVRTATHQLKTVMQTLKDMECPLFIHTGSIFERSDALPAFSPYGEAKTRTWEQLARAAQEFDIPIAKILIPNPVGPFENDDRMIPLFVRMWREGKRPKITTPDTVWDFLPAPWLANRYVELATGAGDNSKDSARVLSPSGYQDSVLKFVKRFVSHIPESPTSMKLDSKIDFKYDVEPMAQQPSGRVGCEPCPELSDPHNTFWPDWMESLGMGRELR